MRNLESYIASQAGRAKRQKLRAHQLKMAKEAIANLRPRLRRVSPEITSLIASGAETFTRRALKTFKEVRVAIRDGASEHVTRLIDEFELESYTASHNVLGVLRAEDVPRSNWRTFAQVESAALQGGERNTTPETQPASTGCDADHQPPTISVHAARDCIALPGVLAIRPRRHHAGRGAPAVRPYDVSGVAQTVRRARFSLCVD